jgi:carbamoylphosphate synthase large subunit
MRRAALVLDGASGPSLAAVRSLGRAGWRIATTAGTRAASSRYTARAFPIPDAESDPSHFAEAVLSALASERFDVVVPATDASVELLWAHERELDGVRILGADRRSFEIATDKARALAAADAAGFGTPAWVAPATVEEAREALGRTGLPCVVKPRRSYVLDGTRLRHRRHGFLRNPADLESALEAGAEPDGTLPVVQAYVPGRALSVSAVLQRGRVVALVAREALTFEPIAGGNSVWRRTIAADDVGVDAAIGLLQSIGYEGLAEVEYQVGADGVPRLMEIGVRIHGWIALAIAAGADLPLVAAQALLGDELPDAPPYRPGVDMRWPVGEVHRVRQALRADDLPPGMSRLEAVAGLWPPWRPGMRYDGIELNDPAPWLPARLRARFPSRRH